MSRKLSFRGWGSYFSFVCLALLILAGVVLTTAVLVRMSLAPESNYLTRDRQLTEKQREFFKFISYLPANVHIAWNQLIGKQQQLREKVQFATPNWTNNFPEPSDPGYLLFSGTTSLDGLPTLKLIRIADGKNVIEWHLDWKRVFDGLKPNRWNPEKGAIANMRATHPLLLSNGDVVFNINGFALVRASPCQSSPVWLLDGSFHHSVQFSSDGKSILAPATSDERYVYNDLIQNRLRDDSIAKISLDGAILENRSFNKILFENNLGAMVIGTLGNVASIEPIHMNEIVEATTGGEFWHQGDLLISARHLSSLFIYRPTTNKIIWHQQGPWLNQHSAAFVGTDKISVFNNNVSGEGLFPYQMQFNSVMVYDFKTNLVSEPFAKLLAETQPKTLFEGRAQILDDGGLFLEETENGRHLRFTSDKLLWSRQNLIADQYLGLLSWSRYLEKAETEKIIQVVKDKNCLAGQAN